MPRPLVRLGLASVALALVAAGCGNIGSPGAAATVNGEAIPRSALESRYDAAAATPQIAQQLEADESGQLRRRLQAQILTELVAVELVRQGAAELGVDVGDDDIAAQRRQLVQQLGGEYALQQAMQRQGLSQAQMRRVLRDRAYRQAVTAELADGDGGGQGVFTDWLTERRQQAGVRVNPAFGAWDAASGRVVPDVPDADAAVPGGSGASPAPAAQGQGAAPPQGDATGQGSSPGS